MSESGSMEETQNKSAEKRISYNDIASKLLEDKFLLAALELHAELVESGRELRILKDFFSNPGNFELQSQEISGIHRSGSQATLDSLDLTRYSEDGGGADDKVAVLEFELRKAKDTINALRNNLTMATESEKNTPDKGSLNQIQSENIKPHEQRALNFLINEYLLIHGYKLTSITFADENENQDFEDWDDVGLNISKPAELLKLYREGLKQTVESATMGTQTQSDSEDDAKSKISRMSTEIVKLKSEVNNLEIQIGDVKTENKSLIKQNEVLSSQQSSKLLMDDALISLSKNSSKDSTTGSTSPECFEIIEKHIMTQKRDSIVTLEDNISNSSFNEWTNLGDHAQETFVNVKLKEKKRENKETAYYNCDLKEDTDLFTKEIFALCYVNLPNKVDNEILNNIVNDSVTNENLVQVLSESLLRIIPNIILNKREEAIPLLISGIHLNNSVSARDKLLQQLFNLKKKPSESERQMILTGIIGIAKYSTTSLIENEILPLCCEQLGHKHLERRLLVAETCTVLIPYVSSPIRNSLLLSMLQQMLDDREDSIRATVIRALALLFALCDDNDKYAQCEELAFGTLGDVSVKVVDVSVNILFPVLARWALDIGRLRSDLIKNLLHKLNESLKYMETSGKVPESDKVQRIIGVLDQVLPFLLVYSILNENVVNRVEKDMTTEIRADFLKLCSSLTNPKNFCKTDQNVGTILYEFDKFMGENPKRSWPELDWIIDIVLPDLLNNLNHVDMSNKFVLNSFISLFSNFCVVFGKNFTKLKIRSFLLVHIESLEQILSSFNQFSPSLNIIPVYLVSVLSYCDVPKELSVILKRFLCALPLCGTPLDCLEITVRDLCELGLQELVVGCLWEAVVHQRPLVRASAATLLSVILGSCNEQLLSTRVTPAIVTLASDSDTLVRTATVPALGSLITDCSVLEIRDKAYMQLQTYASDPSLKENHTLLRQLVVTMGHIAGGCKRQFRNEVILPYLMSISMSVSNMSNQTRKSDMGLALIEAFSNIIYSSGSKEDINGMLLSSLRCLESLVNVLQFLAPHRETVASMIKECDKESQTTETNVQDRNQSKLSQNVNHGVEEMRQRVSKIFNKPVVIKQSTLQNLPGLFKKK